MTDQLQRSTQGLDRQAMKADAAAVLSWLRTSERWTLLDQLATPLLGRSPLRIAFELCSAVIDLPDEELDLLVWLVLDRSLAYLGQAPARSLEAHELEALAALRGAVDRVWRGE